jgi:hypothetical protein
MSVSVAFRPTPTTSTWGELAMGLGQCKRSRAVCKGGRAFVLVTAEPHEPS